ncbi:Vegetative incompatibility protein HET-E-1 [Grifola frondosa]|uniref:Vegetative incompatibility protein HET-E-1 n=1 Tax=Grifola frondosa TaxID=5627 RepID=A0A1C7LPW6_GRIFR|nr:Vegetative incompatibility protein HET-E-1 [Grifola frondosa]
MQAGVQIKYFSLRQCGANKLPKFASVFVQLSSPSYKTHSSRVSKGDVWRQWDATVAVDNSSGFILTVMQKHGRPRRIEELGHIDIHLGDVAESEADATCERKFSLTMADGTSAALEITLSFSGIRFTDGGVGDETEIVPPHPALRPIGVASTSQGPLSGYSNRLTTIEERVNVALGSTVMSHPPEWAKKFQQSAVYLDVIFDVAQSFASFSSYIQPVVKASQSLSKCFVKQGIHNDDDIRELASSMENMLSALGGICRSHNAADKIQELNKTGTIDHAMKAVEKCANFIHDYAHISSAQVLREKSNKAAIEDFRKDFEVLRWHLMSAMIQQTYHVVHISKVDEALEKLHRVKDASHDESVQCLPDTQVRILDSIYRWIDAPEPHKNVLWLHGIAGSGKTTIASTVASQLASGQGPPPRLRRRLLGADFFCKRDVEDLTKPHRVWPTIADHLARTHHPLAQPIIDAIHKDPGLGESHRIMDQFQNLIVRPMSSTFNSDTPIIVIIIDAVDECGDALSRKALLKCLAECSIELPASVKILVTSRPENDIEDSLNNVEGVLLDILENQQRIDVSKYIHHRIGELRSKRADTLGGNWPGPGKTQELVRRSDGLFIWARLSLDFIEDEPSPKKALEAVLSDVATHRQHKDSRHVPLNRLYGTILRSAAEDLNEEKIPLILRVLGCVVAAKVPLSRTSLLRLISNDQYDTDEVSWALGKLASVLPLHGHSHIVRVIHPSFIDFLTTETRAEDFFISISEFNLSMCRASLQLMHQQLKCDICKIGNPTRLNSDVPMARETLQKKDPLLYCCQYWGDHLAGSQSMAEAVMALVELFFTEHLLEWIEILSLADVLECALPSLARIEGSLREISRDAAGESRSRVMTISLGCRDATRFLRYHYSVIHQYALHTYISALAFTPSKSWIAEHYIQKYRPPLRVTVGLDDFWPPQVLAFDRHWGPILDARFSPDKRNIASLDFYGTIHVWNANSGHIFLTLHRSYTSRACE